MSDTTTTTKTTAARKLSMTEQYARDFFEDQKRWALTPGSIGTQIGVVFTASRTWGNVPTVYTMGGKKLGSASGCGYDKHSAALSHSLKFLFEPGTAEYSAIAETAGVGVESLQHELAQRGYILTRTYYGKNEIGYQLTKS